MNENEKKGSGAIEIKKYIKENEYEEQSIQII
jgi:hypothetical protein